MAPYNIRCAGDGGNAYIRRRGQGLVGGYTTGGMSCGWQGNRFGPSCRPADSPTERGEIRLGKVICKVTELTAKPCPRCGGRVEIIGLRRSP
jgi:hypothetical protein